MGIQKAKNSRESDRITRITMKLQKLKQYDLHCYRSIEIDQWNTTKSLETDSIYIRDYIVDQIGKLN